MTTEFVVRTVRYSSSYYYYYVCSTRHELDRFTIFLLPLYRHVIRTSSGATK